MERKIRPDSSEPWRVQLRLGGSLALPCSSSRRGFNGAEGPDSSELWRVQLRLGGSLALPCSGLHLHVESALVFFLEQARELGWRHPPCFNLIRHALL